MENFNNSIKCTVCECAHHAKNQDFCTLDQIKVDKHESTADCLECTDCASFVKSCR